MVNRNSDIAAGRFEIMMPVLLAAQQSLIDFLKEIDDRVVCA